MDSQRSLAITGWGVISPIGIGRPEFIDAVRTHSSAFGPGPAGAPQPPPLGPAAVIPQFTTVAYLGGKGTRSMDRTTAMAVAALGMALEHSGVKPELDRARVGVALGTSTGSIRSISEFTRETLLRERPYLVNPALFPNTVMNCAAGQCAIWHGLKGVNATLSAGHQSGLLALRYASLALLRGYSDVLVTGCVEEFCEESAWAWHHLANGSRPLGEGCTMFVIEKPDHASRNGRPVLAEVLACETAIYARADQGGEQSRLAGLISCIRRVVAKAGINAGEVDAVSASCRGVPALDGLERRAVCTALGPSSRQELAIADLVGDTFSASAGFQLAGTLALFEAEPTRFGHALLTCVGQHGTMGCAVIRNGAA